jgi:DivIVA domain-containing protein
MPRKRKRRDEGAGLGEVTAGFGDETTGPRRERLTPADVQQKVFRLAFRGYNERDVDEFLDQVTEDLATLHEENKRLREQLTEGGMSPEGGAAARQQAEAIVRQAREHAARLVEEAERRGASAGAAPAGSPPSSYLLREREFLQTLASLVQEHARTLKEQAQRVRTAAGPDREQGRPSPGAMPAPAAGAAEPGPAPEPPEPPSSGPSTGPSGEEERTEGASPTAPGASSESSESGGRAAIVIPPAASEAEAEGRSAVKVETASASTAEGPSEAAADRAEGGDPLLSAWETAFTDEEEPAAPRKEGETRRGDRGRGEEPSLRELFWGEE